MPHRIANTDGLCSASDRRRIERANRFWICTGRILGDVHHRHTFAHGKRYRLFGKFEELVERPIFSKKPYRGGSDEGAGFDGNTNTL